MKRKYILLMCLIFVIGFSLGYFVSIPNHITVDIQLDDDMVTITEIQKDIVALQNNCKGKNETK